MAKAGLKTEVIIDQSIEHHVQMVVENADDFAHSLKLIRLLDEDIEDSRQTIYVPTRKVHKEFFYWARDDYKSRLKRGVMRKF